MCVINLLAALRSCSGSGMKSRSNYSAKKCLTPKIRTHMKKKKHTDKNVTHWISLGANSGGHLGRAVFDLSNHDCRCTDAQYRDSLISGSE